MPIVNAQIPGLPPAALAAPTDSRLRVLLRYDLKTNSIVHDRSLQLLTELYRADPEDAQERILNASALIRVFPQLPHGYEVMASAAEMLGDGTQMVAYARAGAARYEAVLPRNFAGPLNAGAGESRAYVRLLAMEGMGFARLERFPEAIKAGRRCLAMDPKDPVGIAPEMGGWSIAAGRLRESLEWLTASSARADACNGYLQAAAHWGLDQHEQAVRTVRIAVHANPYLPAVLRADSRESDRHTNFSGSRTQAHALSHFASRTIAYRAVHDHLQTLLRMPEVVRVRSEALSLRRRIDDPRTPVGERRELTKCYFSMEEVLQAGHSTGSPVEAGSEEEFPMMR